MMHAPEEFSSYLVAREVPVCGEHTSATVGLKNTGLDVYFADGEVLHYDLAGRLLRIARPNVQWRRGLSGRMIELRRRRRDQGGGLARRLLDAAEADRRISGAAGRMARLAWHAEQCSTAPADVPRVAGRSWADALHAAVSFDARTAARDAAQFRTIYHDIPVLPPDQYSSLVVAATTGCRYNECTFCTLYRDTTYHMKPPDEFRHHVEAALAYHGAGLTLRRSVFLGQANALAGPRAWREEIMRIVQEFCEFPPADDTRFTPDWWRGSTRRFSGITSFLDVVTGVRITADEFAVLRGLQLRQISIGMESGAMRLLRWLRKPGHPRQLVDTVRAAKAGGVAVGVIVLVGAGGEPFFDEHVRATVEVLSAMSLAPTDYVYLSPLIAAEASEYAAVAAADGIAPLTPARMAEQTQLIRQGLRAATGERGPYVARYDVSHFVY